MSVPTGFQLDCEQRKRVRDCLSKSRAQLVEPFEKFIARIECSINHFRAVKPKGTFREAHDGLRQIWRLSHEDDPSPALLRVRLKSLPSSALEYLGRRARDVLPRLFPGEVPEGDPFEPPSCFVARFLTWAERAERAELVNALRVLSAEGGRLVPGRSRGGDKRSAARLEPEVIGVTRGSPEPKPAGGRPSEDERLELVMHLSMDWKLATNQAAKRGRTGQTGFDDLVHCVFQWLLVDEDAAMGAATYALRKYWDAVQRAQQRRLP